MKTTDVLFSPLLSSFLLVTPHSNKQKVLQVKEEPENKTPQGYGGEYMLTECGTAEIEIMMF